MYFFYGRPAYKTKKSGSLPLAYDLPVAFILKPEYSLEQIRRILPFDSGAFSNGMYKPYFHPDSKMNDFELDGNTSSARKFLGFFYNSVEEYLVGRSTKNVSIPPTQFELSGLHELARAPANPISRSGDLDERASSVEIQTTRSIEVRGNTLALVLPNILLEDPSVQKLAELCGGKIVSYESMMATSTESFAAVIYDKVITTYREEGILK